MLSSWHEQDKLTCRRWNSCSSWAASMCGPRLASMLYALLFTASNVLASAAAKGRAEQKASCKPGLLHAGRWLGCGAQCCNAAGNPVSVVSARLSRATQHSDALLATEQVQPLAPHLR